MRGDLGGAEPGLYTRFPFLQRAAGGRRRLLVARLRRRGFTVTSALIAQIGEAGGFPALHAGTHAAQLLAAGGAR
ncbi:hypothetical protein ACU4GD_19945 [Cupriavidus basilensis]